MIERCTFGTMTIDGRLYMTDLMIFPDGQVEEDWRRAAGHGLTADDISALIEAQPELIVAGLGMNGRVQPQDDLKAVLADHGIELIAQPTEAAVKTYNAARKESKNVAGCFHLTC
ncbi:MAG: MTH938/NDUFAF3 family protein [Desulfobacteraceae bacterium]|nr:MTH938/NDUFAF3 family protein [Desulfobacteraceae bacterium]